MCYDISLGVPVERLPEYIPGLEIEEGHDEKEPLRNHVIAQAFGKYPVILEKNGKPVLRYFEWGLIASYMNSPEKIRQMRSSMCNARSEKLLETGTAWNRIRKQRCLVPVSGFFEHQEVAGQKKKVPHFVKLRHAELFFLAGLFNYSTMPDHETGELPGTFTIMTSEANSLMKEIHNGGFNKFRMPLILDPHDPMKWISPDLNDEDLKSLIGFQLPSEKMEAWPVFSIRGNKPRPDGKPVTEFWDWKLG